jgi:hypothetical protein
MKVTYCKWQINSCLPNALKLAKITESVTGNYRLLSRQLNSAISAVSRENSFIGSKFLS